MTVSESRGFRTSKISDRGVPSVKTGAPVGVLCQIWMMGALAARYVSRRDLMADRVDSTSTVLSWPSAYLMN
jgi:hypothetical protein